MCRRSSLEFSDPHFFQNEVLIDFCTHPNFKLWFSFPQNFEGKIWDQCPMRHCLEPPPQCSMFQTGWKVTIRCVCGWSLEWWYHDNMAAFIAVIFWLYVCSVGSGGAVDPCWSAVWTSLMFILCWSACWDFSVHLWPHVASACLKGADVTVTRQDAAEQVAAAGFTLDRLAHHLLVLSCSDFFFLST